MKRFVQAVLFINCELSPLAAHELKRERLLLLQNVQEKHVTARKPAESREEAARAPSEGGAAKSASCVLQSEVERVLICLHATVTGIQHSGWCKWQRTHHKVGLLVIKISLEVELPQRIFDIRLRKPREGKSKDESGASTTRRYKENVLQLTKLAAVTVLYWLA